MQFKFHWAAIALLSVFIQGCPSSGVSTTPLGGVAAVGAPLAGATVILVDAAGTTKNVTADAEGAYTFDDVGAMTAPFLLKASGVVGGEEQTIYSALDEKPTPGETAVLNATPMTNAVVAQLSDGDPAKLFAAPTTMGTFIKPADMGAAKQKIIAVLEDQMKEQGLTLATFDPFKTPFKANSSGVDKMFDLVKIRPSATGEMLIQDKSTGVEKSISKTENLTAIQAKKLPPPDPELKKLDFSKVKALVDGMNTAIKDKSSVDAFFDDQFLMDGENKAAFLQKISGNDNAPDKLAGFVFGPCNIEKKVCDGKVAFVAKNGAVIQENFPVKYVTGVSGAADSWKWYGNQREIGFSFNQHLMIENSFTSGSSTIPKPEIRTGFMLDTEEGNDKFSKIELFIGTLADKLVNYDAKAIASWAANLKDCPALVNQLDDSTKKICSSFVDLSKLGIDSKMEDYKKGNLRFKLVFTRKSDSSSKEVQFRPLIEKIPESDAGAYQSFIENAFTKEVVRGFGTSTDFVMPKGVNVEYMTVYLANKTTYVTTVPNLVIASKGGGFTKLGESISSAALCKAHKEMDQNSSCSATDIISAIYWTFKTPLSIDTKVTLGLKIATP